MIHSSIAFPIGIRGIIIKKTWPSPTTIPNTAFSLPLGSMGNVIKKPLVTASDIHEMFVSPFENHVGHHEEGGELMQKMVSQEDDRFRTAISLWAHLCHPVHVQVDQYGERQHISIIHLLNWFIALPHVRSFFAYLTSCLAETCIPSITPKFIQNGQITFYHSQDHSNHHNHNN